MKIVYISDSTIPSPSANSVHVMKMCQAFAGLGNDVTLYAKRTRAIDEVGDVFGYYAVAGGFQVRVMPGKSFKGSGIWYNISWIWRALFISADLIYTRSVIAAFFLILYRKSIIFEVHEPFDSKGWRLRNMFRFVSRNIRLKQLVVISDALKRYFISEGGIPQSRIVVLRDAADPLAEALPILPTNGFNVGYVGSLYQGKGMEILIPLAAACRDVTFHIVGGYGAQIEKWHGTVKTMDVHNIQFHGFKTQSEIPAFIASFDAVIAPYATQVIVSEKDGANNLALWMSPLKIFEYMSAKKPIIATKLPVIEEILTDGESAILCSPTIPQEWVSAIELLRSNKMLRARLANSAFSLFEHHYTWKKRAAYILGQIEAT